MTLPQSKCSASPFLPGMQTPKWERWTLNPISDFLSLKNIAGAWVPREESGKQHAFVPLSSPGASDALVWNTSHGLPFWTLLCLFQTTCQWHPGTSGREADHGTTNHVLLNDFWWQHEPLLSIWSSVSVCAMDLCIFFGGNIDHLQHNHLIQHEQETIIDRPWWQHCKGH